MIASNYYHRILTIAEDYLGPAAGRFIDRQIVHLRKSPDQLQKSDIPILAIRIRSCLVVLSKDEQLVQEAFKRIAAVGDV